MKKYETGLLLSKIYPDEGQLDYAYDAFNRLASTTWTRKVSAGTDVVLRNYTYDALGRPLTRSTSRNGTTQNDTFGYNPRSELTSATLGNANYAYAFDNIGNRETSTEAGTALAYTANNLNQYTEICPEEPIQQTATPSAQLSALQLSYDADGNATLVRTSTGTWAISYNGASRPVRFRNEETDTTVESGYDSQGRRYFKKVTVAGTVTLHHRYIYRGYLQIACVDCTRSGHPALCFVTWDPSQATATRPLAIQKDGTWFTYGYDITKNVCEVFGPAGYIRTSYSYAPFGNVTESGDVTQPFQWSSEHYDSELDLVYYNFRHYSPSLGRFLSRDPIEEKGGRNLYAFVGNSPLIKWDKLGRAMFSCSMYSKRRVKSSFMGIPCSWEGRTCRTKPNHKVTVNGCGSDGTSFVPDSYFNQVFFQEACNQHDRCYGTRCVPQGHKLGCDEMLKDDMQKLCNDAFHEGKITEIDLTFCKKQANIYFEVLVLAGGNAFESAQDEACEWEECRFWGN